MDLVNVGSNIKKAHLKKSYTQAILAEMANISTVHMSHIETGSVAMSMECLISLCNSLDTTPDFLLMGEYRISHARAGSMLTEKTKDLTADENRLLVEMADVLKELKVNKSR
jgi:DNA-binding XRE family transcriptional regulator